MGVCASGHQRSRPRGSGTAVGTTVDGDDAGLWVRTPARRADYTLTYNRDLAAGNLVLVYDAERRRHAGELLSMIDRRAWRIEGVDYVMPASQYRLIVQMRRINAV